ncbi:MAG: hypothetical protein JXR84_21885 [Anaerolineae bacterium]|nr:hypothetical protein [Anaerolineae bacterium]
MAKGLSNRRAEALARQVARWDLYAEQVWLGEVAAPVDYGRPVRVWGKRRYHTDQVRSYFWTSPKIVEPCPNLVIQSNVTIS